MPVAGSPAGRTLFSFTAHGCFENLPPALDRTTNGLWATNVWGTKGAWEPDPGLRFRVAGIRAGGGIPRPNASAAAVYIPPLGRSLEIVN